MLSHFANPATMPLQSIALNVRGENIGINKQINVSVFSLVNSAVSMTLSAFAAERRAVVRLLRAPAPAIDRYLLSAGRSAANSPQRRAASE